MFATRMPSIKAPIHPIHKYGQYSRPCQVRHGNRNRDWDTNNDPNNNPNPNHNQKNMYGYDGYLLFQSEEVKVPITLMEVREAVECCSGITNEETKNTCYLYFGVNGYMAEKYYSKMENMEKAYRKRNEPSNPPADMEPLVSPKQQRHQKKPKKGMFGKWFIFRKNANVNQESEADVE